MQTFLPYPSYVLSAHVLDPRRLGKQRVEGVQILRILAGSASGGSYKWHPNVLMWRGHETDLAYYTDQIMQEWVRRGYKQNMPSPRSAAGAEQYSIPSEWAHGPLCNPLWLGHERFHASHRAALLKKDPDWYAQFCWDEFPVIDYFVPGPIPAPGDLAMSPDREVALVRQHIEDNCVCSWKGLTDTFTVPKRDFVLRIWERAHDKDR